MKVCKTCRQREGTKTRVDSIGRKVPICEQCLNKKSGFNIKSKTKLEK